MTVPRTAPIHLFIDSNIYLYFYDFSAKELEEIKKLEQAVKDRSIILYVTQQVVDEVWRKRDSIVHDILSRVEGDKISSQYPACAREENPHYDALRRAEKEWRKEKEALVNNLRTRAEGYELRADKVIKSLFDLVAEKLDIAECTGAIFESAKRRVDLGNPPGKYRSIGDALNWETLKTLVPIGSDLFIVSADGDYCSDLGKDRPRIKTFLRNEWKRDKSSEVILYTSLPDFSEIHDKAVRLDWSGLRDKPVHLDWSELGDKPVHLNWSELGDEVVHLDWSELRDSVGDILISRLEDSVGFSQTHHAIASLRGCFPFTVRNVERLVNALLDNSQVELIADDAEVKSFFRQLARDHGKAIPGHLKARFLSVYPGFRLLLEDDDLAPF